MKITLTLDDGTTLSGEVSPTTPVPAKDFGAIPTNGPSMDKPRVGYAFPAGLTAFPMPVSDGLVYSIEVIPDGHGTGSGKVTVIRPDGGVVERDITNGLSSAFPVQATSPGTWSVVVACSASGEVRYFV